MSMTRYGLSLILVVILMSSFNITSIVFESYAYAKDVKWQSKLDTELADVVKRDGGDVSVSNRSSFKPEDVKNTIKELFGRSSYHHLVYVIFHGLVFLVTVFYVGYLIIRKNGYGKHIVLTGTLYGIFGVVGIAYTTAYQIFGVIQNEKTIGTPVNLLNANGSHSFIYFEKLKAFRNFCHDAHLKSVKPPKIYVTIEHKNYTESEARKLGYCQEFGARIIAALVGYWTGLMCIIIPCLAACCQPPIPHETKYEARRSMTDSASRGSVTGRHHDLITDNRRTHFELSNDGRTSVH